MTDTDKREYEELNQRYATQPERLTRTQLQRLEGLLSHVIEDPETAALERFLCSLVRLSLQTWMINHRGSTHHTS